MNEELADIKARQEDTRALTMQCAERADNHEEIITGLSKQVETLTQGLADQAKQLKDALEAAKTGSGGLGGGSSSSAGPSRPSPGPVGGGVPYELRTVARLGGLGWDTAEELLMERAGQVLLEARIAAYCHGAAVPVVNRGQGSCVEMVFNTPADLQRAMYAVGALRTTFVDDRRVWLDAKRDRSELRGARITHRVADMLEQLEKKRDDPNVVVKQVGQKSVRVGAELVCFVIRNEIRWTAWAIRRYDVEDLDVAKGYAEAD